MTYAEAVQHYRLVLKDNPNTPAPALATSTGKDARVWKTEMRAYDAVLIELGLATPQAIQQRNSAFKFVSGTYRIVRHARFAQA